MQVTRRFCRLIMMSAAVALAMGCAAPGGPPEPEPMGADIVASEALNPDYSGRASPVVLRIFQLRSAGAFQSSTAHSRRPQPRSFASRAT